MIAITANRLPSTLVRILLVRRAQLKIRIIPEVEAEVDGKTTIATPIQDQIGNAEYVNDNVQSSRDGSSLRSCCHRGRLVCFCAGDEC